VTGKKDLAHSQPNLHKRRSALLYINLCSTYLLLQGFERGFASILGRLTRPSLDTLHWNNLSAKVLELSRIEPRNEMFIRRGVAASGTGRMARALVLFGGYNRPRALNAWSISWDSGSVSRRHVNVTSAAAAFDSSVNAFARLALVDSGSMTVGPRPVRAQ
jgi:hypothetical protein